MTSPNLQQVASTEGAKNVTAPPMHVCFVEAEAAAAAPGPQRHTVHVHNTFDKAGGEGRAGVGAVSPLRDQQQRPPHYAMVDPRHPANARCPKTKLIPNIAAFFRSLFPTLVRRPHSPQPLQLPPHSPCSLTTKRHLPCLLVPPLTRCFPESRPSDLSFSSSFPLLCHLSLPDFASVSGFLLWVFVGFVGFQCVAVFWLCVVHFWCDLCAEFCVGVDVWIHGERFVSTVVHRSVVCTSIGDACVGELGVRFWVLTFGGS